MTKRWRVAGISFEHFHMGDNLRFAFEHPQADIVGVCDDNPLRMATAIDQFGIPDSAVFQDAHECIKAVEPDLIMLCPSTAGHRHWVEQLAEYRIPLLLEKPFAASLEDADAMAAAVKQHGQSLAINWPLAWVPCHRAAHRLIAEGAIGEPLEIHFYDGNRGPLWHTADKAERTAASVAKEKPQSWFYSREAGGGSLLDYLGYGTTLGTWFLQGRKPITVTAVVDEPQGLEVDEHAIVVAQYEFGLSKFETRWGTYTDPWTHQPQPKCGFVIVGHDGTLSSYDYESHVVLQDSGHPEGRKLPADPLPLEFQNPVAHLIHISESGEPMDGPMDLPICRIGQQIVDSAWLSAREKQTVELLGN